MTLGYLNKCKSCIRKYANKRYKDPGVLKRIVEYYKNLKLDKKQIIANREYHRKQRLKYPGKRRARLKVSNAIRDGRLMKKPCEVCGHKTVEAHHVDYRKPFKVRWLCRAHHLAAENKNIRIF